MNAIDDAITFSGLRRRTSTRLVFCMSGVALGTWAPLVPIVKARLSVDEATFGLLLLCMGLGSILIMPVTGYLTSRFGCRVIVTFAFACLCLILPVLTIIKTPMIMAAALVGFGMAMGCNSVAINLQAVLVERHSGKSLMSGFHALFSLGGIAGSGIASAMLSSGISGTTAALVGSAAIAILLIVAREGILAISNDDGERSPAFVVPRGIVVVIGLLALIAMLCEGAILDWGALFLIRAYDTDLATAGFGYTAFATMMTLGRLIGDRVRTRFGDTRILTWSAVLSTIGFLISLASPFWSRALLASC
ncbi:MFS transporter [Rhizobium sp. RCAM05973]|uniref:MFS transporter n=1 Tax=Rhizobium sp. RCAM05973 TaxID=2994066 RepID=UPI0022EBE220|nr:MFS transporter [Rhizobium sp. RCAM05973]